MEVHKPKQPVHGWRALLSEVGIIVIGVLIALGAEQTVEAIHWQGKVVVARREILDEARTNAIYYAFRVEAAPCVVRRLDELNRVTEAVARGERTAPIGRIGLHLGDLINDNAWQAARAEQTLGHLPRRDLDRLSRLYALQTDIKPWVQEEEQAWATVSILEGDPNRLGPADIATVRNALHNARNLEFLIALNSRTLLGMSNQLGIATPKAAARDIRVACAPLERTANPEPMGTP